MDRNVIIRYSLKDIKKKLYYFIQGDTKNKLETNNVNRVWSQ